MGAAISSEQCTSVIHPHIDSCNTWYLLCGYYGFLSAFKMYAPLYGWSSLVQTKFSPSLEHITTKLLPAILRSSMFFGTVAGGFPLMVCFVSRLVFFSAFIGSMIGISVESEKRRVELAVYVMNQALESVYKALMTRKYVPEMGRGSEIVLALSFAILSIFHKHRPQNLASSAKSLMAIIIGTEDKPDKVEALVSRVYFWYKKNFAGTKFAPTWLFSEGVHKSCHHVVEGSNGVSRALFEHTHDHQPQWVPNSMKSTDNTTTIQTDLSTSTATTTTTPTQLRNPESGLPLLCSKCSTDVMPIPNFGEQSGNKSAVPSPSKASPRDGCLEEYKTRLCKHPGGCKSFSAIGGLKGFSLGLAIRFTFSVLPALAKFHNIFALVFWKKIFSETFSYHSLRFAAFLSFISGGTRGMLCFLRLFRKHDDAVNTFLSGAFGGLATIFFCSTEVSMYLVGKALESLFYYACDKGYLTRVTGGGRFLFSVSSAILFWASFFEPHTLRNSYMAFLFKSSYGHWAVAVNAFKHLRNKHLGTQTPNIKEAFDEWNKSFGKPILRQYLGKGANMA